MPAIKPVSDLRNYIEILKDPHINKWNDLTRNGSGACAIMSIREADEYEKLKALHGLLSDLDRAKRRAEREGRIDEEEIDRVMGL